MMQMLLVCCSDYLLMYYLMNRRCLLIVDPLHRLPLMMMVFHVYHFLSRRPTREDASTTLRVRVLAFSP